MNEENSYFKDKLKDFFDFRKNEFKRLKTALLKNSQSIGSKAILPPKCGGSSWTHSCALHNYKND